MTIVLVLTGFLSVIRLCVVTLVLVHRTPSKSALLFLDSEEISYLEMLTQLCSGTVKKAWEHLYSKTLDLLLNRKMLDVHKAPQTKYIGQKERFSVKTNFLSVCWRSYRAFVAVHHYSGETPLSMLQNKKKKKKQLNKRCKYGFWHSLKSSLFLREESDPKVFFFIDKKFHWEKKLW